MPYDVKENGRNGNYQISNHMNTDDLDPDSDNKVSNTCSCHDNDYPVNFCLIILEYCLYLAVHWRNSRTLTSFIVQVSKVEDILVVSPICVHIM